METLQGYFKNPIVWFVMWILLAMTNAQLYELINKIGELLGNPFKALMNGTDELREETKKSHCFREGVYRWH